VLQRWGGYVRVKRGDPAGEAQQRSAQAVQLAVNIVEKIRPPDRTASVSREEQCRCGAVRPPDHGYVTFYRGEMKRPVDRRRFMP